MDDLSSEAIRSLLTSLFSSQMVEDLAREREVVIRDRKIDIRTLVVGFAGGVPHWRAYAVMSSWYLY